MFHELLFQDELTSYGRLLKDKLDLPYPSTNNIQIGRLLVLVSHQSLAQINK